MALHADSLIDRIKLKSQLNRWRLIAIAVAVLATILLVEEDGDISRPIRGDYIARITVDGIIGDDRKLTELIETVRKDSYARAVVVWIDSPGGSAVGGQQLYLDLTELSKEKPVVTVMRSIAASAGYMIALGSDHILAREGTITGSVGVIMQTMEVTELAEKLGIRPITIKSGEFKASPNPTEKYTPEQDAIMQAMIQDFFRWFLELVVKERHLTPEQAAYIADGRVLTGRQAVQYKLVDGLGGEKEALEWLRKNKNIAESLKVEDVKPKEDNSFFNNLSSIASGKFFSNALQGLDGLMAIWHPKSL